MFDNKTYDTSTQDLSEKSINSKENNNLDLTGFISIRKKGSYNPMICYLNIKSLQIKIDASRRIIKISAINIVCIDETKLGSSFADSQFEINGYQFLPYRKYIDQHEGEKVVFIKEILFTNISNAF